MLDFNRVRAQYGAVVALRDVSISIREGELVALIGTNGAGKSTTLSCIAGVVKPVQGSITFLGASLVGKSPEEIARKGISMVPEDRGIFPSLTVEENLRLGAYVRKNPTEYQQDVEEISDLFPILRERINQPSGTLSGGEQQQLAIARALMSHPKLLMLDEPSLGLAPILVDQIFEMIVGLHQSGVTILMVEQNVDRTLEIVDRAYLLNTGRVESYGTPEEMRKQVDIESVYLGGRNKA